MVNKSPSKLSIARRSSVRLGCGRQLSLWVFKERRLPRWSGRISGL